MDRLDIGWREHFDPRAIRVHQVNLLPAVAHQHECNAFSVWGPGRVLVIGVIARQLCDLRAVQAHPEQLFLARHTEMKTISSPSGENEGESFTEWLNW